MAENYSGGGVWSSSSQSLQENQNTPTMVKLEYIYKEVVQLRKDNASLEQFLQKAINDLETKFDSLLDVIEDLENENKKLNKKFRALKHKFEVAKTPTVRKHSAESRRNKEDQVADVEDEDASDNRYDYDDNENESSSSNDQYVSGRKLELLFDNINEAKNADKRENFTRLIIKECKKIGIEIQPSDIQFAERIGPRQTDTVTGKAKSRTILVRFISSQKRNEILDKKNEEVKKITSSNSKTPDLDLEAIPKVREHLTIARMRLMRKVDEDQVANRIQSSHVVDGHIIVQRRFGSPQIIVDSEQQLNNLLRRN